MDEVYSLLQVVEHKLLLRQCELGWEVVHVDFINSGQADCAPDELDELTRAFNELGVRGLSSDATRNSDSSVRLTADASRPENPLPGNGLTLSSNVTFAKVTGAPPPRRLSERDLFQVDALCSQSECHKGAGAGALCFRAVSGQKKVSLSEGSVQRDVVIIKVESSNSDRFKAHSRYVKLLAAHGVGPKLYTAECSAVAHYYFTERLGTCTNLDQFLESAQTQALTPAQLEKCTRSLATLSSILAGDNRNDACFHYRGDSYKEFLEDALVDVATGQVYLWRTRHISYFLKNCWEESIPLGYDLKQLGQKRTKSECTRTLWSFLAKISDALQAACVTSGKVSS